MLEINASAKVVGIVLLQDSRPIAFESKKLNKITLHMKGIFLQSYMIYTHGNITCMVHNLRSSLIMKVLSGL